ncbi:efflux transporter periplasmic adaptor subunit [Flavobacterium aquidurense]|uniref:efflux RND transporter periplasmic adaptor subunit n=1 Tax=Flavobacterium aquidurense TaxID=362413 RepID=UPI00091DB35F|nr:efflux RND transporter periplasmic adaptor subunit [Flavobacterium aquidurense]OXA70466.1 efflux transporter periplasmic adaptor subunit [Flavobacterium aquidurense]SHH72949.1 RND family efflux transporter, MFP subunit [Flavobacterium frigidimaris]
MKKKYIIILSGIVLAGLITFKLGYNKSKINKSNTVTLAQEIKIPVTVSTVKKQLQQINMIKTGVLAPFKEAKLISVSSGNVQKLLIKLGDRVNQGQVLAIIDTRLLQLDLQKSETKVSKLRSDLKTYTELLQGNAATQEKVNEIRQNYQDAVNASDQIKRQLNDARIKAPTSGIIGSKTIEEGVFVSGGSEIATIVNLSQLKVQVNLTETEVYKVKEGQKVKLTTDIYPGKVFEGVISYISPQADQTHSYATEIRASNDKDAPLRSGTFVYTDFSRKTNQSIILIPREALTQSTKNATVYVVKNGRVRLRKIKTGSDYNNAIQVLSGLTPGEQVVTSGQINLKDDALISISKQ